MDIANYNRGAWNRQVEIKNPWTRPVLPKEIEAARCGEWTILLTPAKPVPRDWLGNLKGTNILCLAAGGGQQAPILAAAGAQVTILDNSPAQLAQDQMVAHREQLEIRLELGEMEDLSRFANSAFDLIIHPVSNLFTSDVKKVWREAHRIMRTGGILLSGFANPVFYLFDQADMESGIFAIRYPLPYSDLKSLSTEALDERIKNQEPLEFSHSLNDQIGGQIDTGFVITGFYEDGWPDHPLDKFLPTFMATRALKP